MLASLPADRLPARLRHAAPVLGLAALVLWLHGLLIGALALAPARQPGQLAERSDRPAALQVRTVAAAVLPVPVPAGEPTPPAPPVLAQARPPGQAVPPAPVPDRASARTLAPAADAAPSALPPAAAPADAIDADTAAPLPQGPDAAPPPVYTTRIPPPVLLDYALRYNGQAGEAQLAWRHDGQQYQLALLQRAASPPLVAQTSHGGFDAAGLAPERFTDRRRGKVLQAANFRRDIGRIGFSGPVIDYPAWPGAQDRLSWLVQFVAIRAAAAPDAPLPAIDLFVVDARGAGGLWQFRREADTPLATPAGLLATERWLREPPRPEGLRVEAWLDPARGHWPALLRYTALRSGDVFELRLRGEPAKP